MGIDKIFDRLDEKLKEMEDNIDEEDIPAWTGTKKKDNSGEEDSNSVDSDEVDGIPSEVSYKSDDDKIVIEIELPGYSPDNISAQFNESDNLIVEADGNGQRDDKDYQFELPDNASQNHTESKFSHGLLQIVIPKTE